MSLPDGWNPKIDRLMAMRSRPSRDGSPYLTGMRLVGPGSWHGLCARLTATGLWLLPVTAAVGGAAGLGGCTCLRIASSRSMLAHRFCCFLCAAGSL